MTIRTNYRVLLPAIQTVAATLFGGLGLWQRHAILNHPFMGDQTMWDTTARFHVWPHPYRFAVITNIPAFLAAALVEWPLESLWPNISEWFHFSLFVVCVPALWYFLGKKFDNKPMARERFRNVLMLFTALSVAAVFTPGNAVAYVFSGCLLWLVFVIFVARVRGAAR